MIPTRRRLLLACVAGLAFAAAEALAQTAAAPPPASGVLELRAGDLGWSGDTITLQPRPLNFGEAAKHLQEQKADVILAFFGLNESFDGEGGLARFEQDLAAYLDGHARAQYNGRAAPR